MCVCQDSGHATSPQHTCTRVKDLDHDDDDLKYDVMGEYTSIEKRLPVKVWFVHLTCSSTPAMGRQVQNWSHLREGVFSYGESLLCM